MTALRRTLFTLMLAIPFASCTGSDLAATDRSTEVGDAGTDGGGHDCVKTQGYWKNHVDAWPVTGLALGTTSYTQDELLAILHEPVRGNGLVQLAHQLIAARLNLAAGGSDSIGEEVTEADDLIGALVAPPIGEGRLEPSATSGVSNQLDVYNNSADCDDDEPACGDGIEDDDEQCDDGNTADGDGCSATCTTETPPNCGNGTIDEGETCDDGNTADGDGCSAMCTCDTPHEPACGDGTVDVDEACDDGNTADGDGCSATCRLEPSCDGDNGCPDLHDGIYRGPTSPDLTP